MTETEDDAIDLVVDELRSIRRSIARTVDRRDRLRAIFLPDSLVTRFRYDPDA